VIARAVRLSQATSSTTSVVLLIAFNLVPLVGVIAWGWNVSTILVLYWLENGIVGVLNVPKILLAQGAPPAMAVTATGLGPASKIGTAGFFVLHYGIFWLVHGIFVFTLPMFGSMRDVVTEPFGVGVGFGVGFEGTLIPGDPTSAVDATAVTIGVIGLAISRGASFVVNYLGRREYLTISPQQQAFAPYPRLVILHVTIIIGAFVSLLIGSPVGAIVALVVVKTVMDLGFHVREHAAIAERAAGGTGAPPSGPFAFEGSGRVAGPQPESEIDVPR
jgi:hypothetical protein